MNENRLRIEREPNENRTRTERRMIRKIYRQNCWLDCDTVSMLMISLGLIKVDFGTFLFDDDPIIHCKNLRHINILLPNTEHCQTYCLKTISLHTPTIVCLSLAIVIRNYDKSKINLPCSTVPHSFILRSIPYCFRINPVSFPYRFRFPNRRTIGE